MNPHTETVLNYHHRTKHTLQRYAKGPETIDWEDQPDQFRRFSGCETIALPMPGQALKPLFTDLDNPQSIDALPLNLESLGLLLELAFGLSAWKEFGPSRWSLRCNPSSGNLHPTEAYVISTGNGIIQPGVHHYVSHDHCLEQRCLFSDTAEHTDILIGLSSVHWREAWKYGERAYRYCQHDTGHALGALHYAAATLGWSVELLPECSDAEISSLLGLDRKADFKPLEEESPDIVCRIHTQTTRNALTINTLLENTQSGIWYGKADSLRAYHFYKWPVIDEIATAAHKPHTEEAEWLALCQFPATSSCTQTATEIIRQRRSAQQFDGKMPPLPMADFQRMLAAVLPCVATFGFWRWPPKVHLFLFVHRVEGLTPGLYALPRDDAALAKLQAATLSSFDWQKQPGTLPFYHLYSGDVKQIAKTLSCHQPIASDSAFSVAMVAEFSETLALSPWLYRRLFWECGLIGQVLYLEAEAAGIRGTGIGCYFDDSVHEILGIKDDAFQSLYHFTVGKPLEDKRLQTFPAYGHLQNAGIKP
ncbi:MAG: SagB/ThcOx family dehydrogenase [Methylovulum sp.]|uniref:SagB/ThcOx family dehydrogenase n=1 Tax=Methylovulum sp. TaxID=1916980 RepID=UPI002630BFC6|nr:SagB/ThcOx family dehydrogenase [Methylovulum sp.]MDD2722877.1 SagB/ThcOx family dehydrogenase [Methylovulum sp.]MDD5125052.1 SagB/ThcOx family dehydrogenase [Methylovulum sp.]